MGEHTAAALAEALREIVRRDLQRWRIDHADMVMNKVAIEVRDGPMGGIARRALAEAGCADGLPALGRELSRALTPTEGE